VDELRRRLTAWRVGTGALAASLVIGIVGACSGGAPNVAAATLLTRAKAKADNSPGVHFALTSSNVSTSGTNILSGSGDLARPDQIQGSFEVSIDGFTAKVGVASVNGVFEALTPFSTHYVRTDPSKFGLTDPAQLLNQNKGLTSLLAIARDPRNTKAERINGELLEDVTFTVPGTAIPVLPDAAPSQPVTLAVAINPESFEMRRVTMTGPLTSAKYNSTYVLTLTNYGQHVNITLPPIS
jgi:lipoprotein LprG